MRGWRNAAPARVYNNQVGVRQSAEQRTDELLRFPGDGLDVLGALLELSA